MEKKELIIRDAKLTDIKEILEISADRLGEGYLSKEKLECLINSKKEQGCVVSYDIISNKVAGFCTYSVCGYDLVKEIARGEVEVLKKETRIGHIESAAVSREYRGCKIGNAVIESAMKALEEIDVNHYFASAWKPNGKINVEHVLVPLGFIPEREIEDYWYEDSIKKGYLCPECGNPCRCSCVIFAK